MLYKDTFLPFLSFFNRHTIINNNNYNNVFLGL